MKTMMMMMIIELKKVKNLEIFFMYWMTIISLHSHTMVIMIIDKAEKRFVCLSVRLQFLANTNQSINKTNNENKIKRKWKKVKIKNRKIKKVKIKKRK